MSVSALKIKNFFEHFATLVRQSPFSVIAVILVYVIFNNVWTYEAAFFWSLFLFFLLLGLDNRILISFGLMFLILSPFYLILKQPLKVQQFTDYAYYFLFLGILLQLIGYGREKFVSFWQKRQKGE